ncbi:hypothetical protein Acsp02_80150 [Actinoplanes sp. NBRC 103695]|nr:hypothetical protein Acsp02_80150 [Actinoplanes sp. NBRC 103695]
MPSSQSASVLSSPARVYDRPLWIAGQQLMADHLPVPADGNRCQNPRCTGRVYPCTPARTAARLALASQMPFHKRMTALTDALTCSVPPPSYLSSIAFLDADRVERWHLTAAASTGTVAEPALATAAVA